MLNSVLVCTLVLQVPETPLLPRMRFSDCCLSAPWLGQEPRRPPSVAVRLCHPRWSGLGGRRRGTGSRCICFAFYFSLLMSENSGQLK